MIPYSLDHLQVKNMTETIERRRIFVYDDSREDRDQRPIPFVNLMKAEQLIMINVKFR